MARSPRTRASRKNTRSSGATAIRGWWGSRFSTERAHIVVARSVENLKPHHPRMAVAPELRVFFRDARVRGDRAIEKIVRVRAEQGAYSRREKRRAAQHRLAEQDVRSRRPRPRNRWEQRDQHERADCEPRD